MSDKDKKIKVKKGLEVAFVGLAFVTGSMFFDKLGIPGSNLLFYIGLVSGFIGLFLFYMNYFKK